MPPGNIHYPENHAMQNARSIALLMFQYSIDHDNQYPTGKNSTEAFQKLLDEKYLTDPALFYFPLPGKVKGTQGQKLKPENVSWDITGGLDKNDPDQTPVVFLTGYKIDYLPGGAAIPVIKPHPVYGNNVWTSWWRGDSRLSFFSGIAVCYKGNNATFKALDTSKNPDGVISSFIPTSFAPPPGKTYHQLTPDGPLP